MAPAAPFPRIRSAALACGMAALLVPAASAAFAESVSARYQIRAFGITIGSARMNAEFAGDAYSATLSGGLKGVARLFSDGKGDAQVSGRIVDGKIAPASYTLHWSEDNEDERLRMAFGDGRLQTFEMDPPLKPRKNRVPLTEEHKVGVLDPLSAVLVPTPAGDPQAACDRSVRVMEGRTRFDLVLAYAGTETVSGGKDGYSGPAIVCSMRYRAVAGHKADKEDIAALEAEKTMRVWMAPVGNSGMMVPVKLHIRTKKAPLTLTADRFSVE
jgi:hypothetical protein